ncbi:hypothetical protein C6Y45_11080 [Alkalicoccus saliphilus]|uniref:Uncharacterized protein n=1 Tax=Alkalicoccus saliphilus TaxID=200989 RepID=A0A2T4U4Z8_9BACI|nr:hypothetical protein C6Y45_11080 [Alkalicoccus saliphilus]
MAAFPEVIREALKETEVWTGRCFGNRTESASPGLSVSYSESGRAAPALRLEHAVIEWADPAANTFCRKHCFLFIP